MAHTRIGYARCSTNKQELVAQRAILHELGVEEDRIYMDRGLTGTNPDRPGLDQALAAVRAGDTLFVSKLDRLETFLKLFIQTEIYSKTSHTPMSLICLHWDGSISVSQATTCVTWILRGQYFTFFWKWLCVVLIASSIKTVRFVCSGWWLRDS